MIGSSDKARAATYTQLAAMERAGLPLMKALAHVSKQGGPAASLLLPLERELKSGKSLPEALASVEGFSPLEIAVMSAGNTAGSLPECFQQLAQTFERRAALKVKVAGALAYPTLLLHLAILLPNLFIIIKDGLAAYLAAIAVPFGVLYGVVGGGFFLIKFLRKTNPALLDRFLLAIPLIRGVERKVSLAYGVGAFSLLYRNGVSIIESLETAGNVTPNSVIASVFDRMADTLRSQGSDLAAALALEAHNLPDWAVELLSTGATSGQLDGMLENVTTRLDEEVQTDVSRLVVALGGAVFAFAALVVAYKVISFYAGYVGQINKLTGGR
jgi:type IV pilus assembly protein PilC